MWKPWSSKIRLLSGEEIRANDGSLIFIASGWLAVLAYLDGNVRPPPDTRAHPDLCIESSAAALDFPSAF